MRATVAVLGAGAWGVTIAKVAAEKGHETTIWCYEKETANEINQQHTNKRFLPGIKLPAGLKANNSIYETASEKQFLILAPPSMFLLDLVKELLTVPSIQEGRSAIAVITKGFMETSKGPSLILEALEEHLPESYGKSLVYIAGPSHAEEVAQGKITGLIAASRNPKNAIRFRDLLKSQRLLVFASLDVCGVQVAAAVKNVIAIGFGIMDALKTGSSGAEDMFGDNTESLLLATGLNEIQILGMAMGSTHPETFTSISGVGDLDVSCRSVFGRNRRLGRDIIEKNILKDFNNIEDLLKSIEKIGYYPEGVVAARYVNILAEKYRLKMPLSTGLYQILNKEMAPLEFLRNFLGNMV